MSKAEEAEIRRLERQLNWLIDVCINQTDEDEPVEQCRWCVYSCARTAPNCREGQRAGLRQELATLDAPAEAQQTEVECETTAD